MTRISFVVLAAFILLVSFMGPRPAQAQCVNTATPSCGVYEACFAKYCPCKNDADEYFITYGKKYCERFLSKTSLSDAGKAWRDKTYRKLFTRSIGPRQQPKICNRSELQPSLRS